ncbi:gas vesicle protein [Gloeocapsa sp. PCC 73106]|nr:gas vesicle protein [Gloeocapsa sp. PCC 73106]
MSKTNKQSTLITGLVIGSAVGTLAGLLLALGKSKETRVLVKKSLDALPEMAEDLVTTTQLRGKQWSNKARGRWEKSLNRLQKAIKAGVEAGKQEPPTAPTKITVD